MSKMLVTVAFVTLCSALTVGSQKKVVRPTGAEPSASWSHGILVGDTLYISGMGGEDATGKISGDFETEVQQALENIGAVLKAAGMSAGDVVAVQVYLTDATTFERRTLFTRHTSRTHVRPEQRLLSPNLWGKGT